MESIATTNDFLELLGKSSLVDEPVLAAWLKDHPAAATGTAVDLARELYRDGLLTDFQAQQLLRGRWRGFIVGKYRVLELLGAGGMGAVWLCEHKLLKKLVAVKMLPTAKMRDGGLVERFCREARAAIALNHPNIVRAFDLDQDDKMLFLVMEFVEGVSLHDLVARHGPLAIPRVAHYLAQVAQGLQHAHEMGWVHRDIKPSNLLVDRAGVVKILDMGLVRHHYDQADNLTKQYDDNRTMGSIDYLAPEQAVNSHTVDIRADLYSLGATGYYLLTGRPPFGVGTIPQKLVSHQLQTPPPLASLRPDTPDELAAVIEKMMAKDPAERYQTPAELEEALVLWTRTPIEPPTAEELRPLSPAVRKMLPSLVGVAAPVRPPSEEPLPTLPAGPGTPPTVRITTLPGRGARGATEAMSLPRPRSGPRIATRSAPPRKQRLKRQFIAAAGLLLCGVLGVGAWGFFALTRPKAPSFQSPVPPTQGPSKPIQAIDAGKHVNQKCTVRLVVANTGKSNSSPPLLFLNSEINYRSPTCFTIVINKDVEEKYRQRGVVNLENYFINKAIHVTGVISTYSGRPQIVIKDPEQIHLHDPKVPLKIEQLPTYVDENCTFDMEVRLVFPGKQFVTLNSEANPNSDKNVAVLLNRTAQEAFTKPGLDARAVFQGKTIRVKGKLLAWKSGYRFEVTHADQLHFLNRD